MDISSAMSTTADIDQLTSQLEETMIGQCQLIQAPSNCLVLVLVVNLRDIALAIARAFGGLIHHNNRYVLQYGGGEGQMYTRHQIMFDLCRKGIALIDSFSQILFNHNSGGIYSIIPEMQRILNADIRTIIIMKGTDGLTTPTSTTETSHSKYLEALLENAETLDVSLGTDQIIQSLAARVPKTLRQEFSPSQARILVSYPNTKKGDTYHHVTLYHRDSPPSEGYGADGWNLDVHQEVEDLVVEAYGPSQPAFLINFEARNEGRKSIKYSLMMMVKELWPGHLSHITVSPGQLPPVTSKIFVASIRQKLAAEEQEPTLEQLQTALTDLVVEIPHQGEILRFQQAVQDVIVRGFDGKAVLDAKRKPVRREVKIEPTPVTVTIHGIFAGNS